MTDVIKNISTNTQVSSTGTNRTPQTTNEASTSKANTAAVNAADQVDLTNSAQKVEQAISSLSAAPIVDRQKVDDIKSALVEGRYEVDSAVIADKLIEIDELLK